MNTISASQQRRSESSVALCCCYCSLFLLAVVLSRGFSSCHVVSGVDVMLCCCCVVGCVLVVMCTIFSGRLMKMLLFLFFVVDIIKHGRRCCAGGAGCCSNKPSIHSAEAVVAAPSRKNSKRHKSREAKRRVATRFLPSLSVVKVGHCEMTAPNQPGAQNACTSSLSFRPPERDSSRLGGCNAAS